MVDLEPGANPIVALFLMLLLVAGCASQWMAGPPGTFAAPVAAAPAAPSPGS